MPPPSALARSPSLRRSAAVTPAGEGIDRKRLLGRTRTTIGQSMKRILFALCAVAIATGAIAAERSRYIVATRSAPRAARLALVDDGAQAWERDVRTFDSVDAFAADLTDAEAAQLRRATGVRWVHP